MSGITRLTRISANRNLKIQLNRRPSQNKYHPIRALVIVLLVVSLRNGPSVVEDVHVYADSRDLICVSSVCIDLNPRPLFATSRFPAMSNTRPGEATNFIDVESHLRLCPPAGGGALVSRVRGCRWTIGGSTLYDLSSYRFNATRPARTELTRISICRLCHRTNAISLSLRTNVRVTHWMSSAGDAWGSPLGGITRSFIANLPLLCAPPFVGSNASIPSTSMPSMIHDHRRGGRSASTCENSALLQKGFFAILRFGSLHLSLSFLFVSFIYNTIKMKMQSAKWKAEAKLEVREVRHSFRIQELHKEETFSHETLPGSIYGAISKEPSIN